MRSLKNAILIGKTLSYGTKIIGETAARDARNSCALPAWAKVKVFGASARKTTEPKALNTVAAISR